MARSMKMTLLFLLSMLWTGVTSAQALLLVGQDDSTKEGQLTLFQSKKYGTVFQATTSGIGTEVRIYISSNTSLSNQFEVGIYECNASHYPTTLLASASVTGIAVGDDIWFATSINANIIAGNYYYLCFGLNYWAGTLMVGTNSTGGIQSYIADNPGLPNTFPTGMPTTSTRYIINCDGFIPTATPTSTRTPVWTPSITPTITPTSTITPLVFVTQSNLEDVIAYPSPATGPTVWFSYSASSIGSTQIEIFNIMGEKVDTVNQSVVAVGDQKVQWNIEQMAPGVYFYLLKRYSRDTNQTTTTKVKKMVIER
jgi:hypothetical protein